MASNLERIFRYRQELIRVLRPENSFVNASVNLSAFGANGEVLNVPIEKDDAQVFKNPSNFPLSVDQHEYDQMIIILDRFLTGPQMITDAEQKLEYAANASRMIQNHVATIRESIHNDTLLKWVQPRLEGTLNNSASVALPSDNVYATTGSGSPNKVKRADVQKAAELFDTADDAGLPSEGRYVIMPPSFKQDILGINEYNYTYITGAARSPIMSSTFPTEIDGFIPIVRTKLPKYDTNSGEMVPYDSTSATAVECAIFWQQEQVGFRLDDLTSYSKTGVPEYGGADIYNFSGYSAAGRLRNNGVAVLYRGS